ncbi:MAG: hypothetical protein OXT65_04135, partial [Alphaproteobacteria bacterium]|nr:hypothetical protein [Alphaproteobacteria bacterium]
MSDMTKDTNPKSFSGRKVSELTDADKSAVRRPLGVPGLPYPMVHVADDAGADASNADFTIGVVQSDSPFMVYSGHMSAAQVNGRLLREMPLPNMAIMLRDLITMTDPEAKNRSMTIFGDAAFGKSHLFKMMGEIVHEKGAASVDCGGMNMRELLFRTVVSYGEGVREQFEERLAGGDISPASVNMLNEAFPGAIDEKTIDWSKVGAAQTWESSADAGKRAVDVMKTIYELESIEVRNNSFGIRTEEGEVLKAFREGRPVFLDEYNKSRPGTLDAFQTFLQFVKGEIDEVDIENPLAQDGGADKTVKLKREDMKAGFCVFIAGNDSSDGSTTHDISLSMRTRLDPRQVGQPSEEDWAHRISQILTGMPLTTLYTAWNADAQKDPNAFANKLMQVRKLGLTPAQQRAIPPHQIHFLQEFEDTIKGIRQLAKYYHSRLQLSDTNSKAYDNGKHADMADEVSGAAERIHVSFRRVIKDLEQALERLPEVANVEKATLAKDINALFENLETTQFVNPAPAWHTLGTGWGRAIQEDIMNATVGMPNTRSALLTIAQQYGVTKRELSEAKESNEVKPLAELLRFGDGLDEFGGKEYLEEVREILLAAMAQMQSDEFDANPDQIMPLRNVGMALRTVQESQDFSQFTIPNENLEDTAKVPVIPGGARIISGNVPDDLELVDYRAVVAGLALPRELGSDNLNSLWIDDSSTFLPADDELDDDEKKYMEAIRETIERKSPLKIHFSVVSVANKDDEGNITPDVLLVLEDADQEEGGTVIVGPSGITDTVKGALSKNKITY